MIWLLFYIIVHEVCPLQLCPEEKDLIPSNDSFQTMSKSQCLSELKGFVAKRNFFYIRSYESSDPVTMICEGCEKEVMPYWYFIPRNSNPLIDFTYTVIHGSNLVLLQNGLRVKDENIYCLTKKNSLVIKAFDPERVLGTYYCSSGKNSLVSYMWHHVDTYYNADDSRISRAIVTHKAYNHMQIEAALQSIEDELKQKYAEKIFQDNLVKLFYALTSKPTTKGLCGDVKMKYMRRCYIQFPQNLSETQPLSRSEYAIYFSILEAVRDVTNYKTMSEKIDGRSYTAAKVKAANIADSLGFELMHSIPDIVIPCHFSLLKHLESMPQFGNPFGVSNPYGVIETQLKCPEVNPMDIIRLAMARDIGKLKMQVLGEVQKSMRAIDKIFLQGSVNEKLICGFASLSGDLCSARRIDVQWRKGDFVFTIESVVKQRVYVTANCILLFSKMRLRDRGTYHCYRKSVDKVSWSLSATSKFLVQVERAKNPLPEMKMVLKYFTVLVLWTGFLFLLWLFLTFMNIKIKINARYRAEERKMLLQAQSRRRRQMKTKAMKSYSSNVNYAEETEDYTKLE